MNDSINNFINSDDDSALFVDGEWGTGKTYYFKNTIIPKYRLEGYPVMYFSSYGYSSLEEVKKNIVNNLFWVQIGVSEKVKKRIIEISDSTSKIMGIFNSKVKDSAIEMLSLLRKNYQQMKELKGEKQPIIIIDDIERLSENINRNDYFGFILTELVENLHCKVLMIGNIHEINDVDKTKEKLISREIPFNLSMEKIKKDFFENEEDNFLSNNASWIVNILKALEVNSGERINLRTIEFVNNTFKFISKRMEGSKFKRNLDAMKKSIYLNLLFISIEYKSGRLTRNNLADINPILNTRSFNMIGIFDEKNNKYKIVKHLMKTYHVIDNITDYIMYSSQVSDSIFFNVFDEQVYIKEWRKLFEGNETTNYINKLNEFRSLNDKEIQNLEYEVLNQVKENKIEVLDELLNVLDIFLFFEKNDLIFVEYEYKKLILEKVENHLINIEDMEDLLFRYHNINQDSDIKKKLNSESKEITKKNNNIKIDGILEKLFNGDWQGVKKLYDFAVELDFFSRIKDETVLNNNILKKHSSANNLSTFIRRYYLNISNAREFHSNEIPDIQYILNKIRIYLDARNDEIEKIDSFNLRGLVETLEELIEHLGPKK